MHLQFAFPVAQVAVPGGQELGIFLFRPAIDSRFCACLCEVEELHALKDGLAIGDRSSKVRRGIFILHRLAGRLLGSRHLVMQSSDFRWQVGSLEV
jgi:hypothetical protein